MFAMALTTLIGAGVSAMIVSVSYGTTTRSEQSRVNIKQKIVSARISAAIRSSKMVLAEGPEHLVLWTGDARKNSKPNLS